MSDTAIADYTPRQIIEDDLGGMSLEEAMAATMVAVEDGQLVTGTVVKVDRDEVLLDIGYKSEGVIPNRELSIRNEVDPNEVVSVGDDIEALVLQKEDKTVASSSPRSAPSTSGHGERSRRSRRTRESCPARSSRSSRAG